MALSAVGLDAGGRELLTLRAHKASHPPIRRPALSAQGFPGQCSGAASLATLMGMLLLPACLIGGTCWAQEDGRRVIGATGLEVRYWPQHEDMALEVSQWAVEDIRALSHYLELEVKSTILIEIVRSHRELQQRLGSRVYPWTQGVSVHHRGHVLLKPLTAKALRRLVRHELTHVALDMKMSPSGGEPPRWLHEGLAQWMEGDMPAVQKDILGRAAVAGELLGLDELEPAFSGKRETVDLAYAQSMGLVSFMVDNGPDGVIGNFLQYLSDGGDAQVSLRRAMGLPLSAIERRWLSDMQHKYITRGVPITVELLVFAGMAAIFVVAVVVRLRIARQIRQRMQQEEQFEALVAGLELPEEHPEQGDDSPPRSDHLP